MTGRSDDAVEKPLTARELIADMCRFFSKLEKHSGTRWKLRECCNRTITAIADRDFRDQCRTLLRTLSDDELRGCAGDER